MQRSKNYLCLGIVLGIFAAVISLMCIAFSYADVNELNVANNDDGNQIEAVVGGEDQGEAVEEEINDINGLSIKVIPQGVSDEKFKKYCQIKKIEDSANVATWNDDTKTLIFDDSVSAYRPYLMTSANPTKVYIEVPNGMVVLQAEVNDTTKVAFDSWGYVPEIPRSDDLILYPEFTDINPEFSSVTVYGNVEDDETSKALAGADVSLSNNVSGEVYATTHADADGNYALTNINADLFKDPDTLKNLIVVTSYPGYEIRYWDDLDKQEIEKIVDGVAYLRHKFHLDPADVVILGAEHHQNFVIDMSIYVGGEFIANESHKFTVENVGFNNSQIPAGADFTIDENSVFNGYSDLSEEYGDDSYVLLTAKPVAADGYSFDYVEVGGQKITNGESFTFDGKSQYSAMVYYKSANATEIAQTGDAIPFAVLIALGIVAGLSVVAIRKFSK